MEKKRKGFVFYDDWYKTIKTLPDKDRLDAYDAIVNEGLCYEHRDNYSQIANIVLQMALPQLKRDVDKYTAISLKRAEVGRLGGEANASKRKQMVAIATINNNINNNIKEKEDNKISSKKEIILKKEITIEEDKKTSIKKRTKKAFVPPTLEEVEAYIREKGYHFNAQAFIDYYEADDWHYGKDNNRKKVSNWKRCCATWDNNNNNNTSLQTKENKDNNVLFGADYPASVDDVQKCDIHSYPNPWYEWMYERCPKVSKGARKRYNDWDKIDQNWTKFVNMCGGEKTLSYACLVLERDGYEEYYDKNGFMWMIRNFLEKNGLYNGK